MYEQLVIRERAIADADRSFVSDTFHRPPPEIEDPDNSPANYVVVPHEEIENACFICCSDVVYCKLNCCEYLLCIDCVKRVNFIFPQCRRDFTDYVYIKPIPPKSIYHKLLSHCHYCHKPLWTIHKLLHLQQKNQIPAAHLQQKS